ncbi:hypothetical protein HaLaN_10363 [Haematococcus lacustris]|uniref:Uncharacterized protein n=1 Tax=Haematococcus lacustris TaxID=44745 RepID=A0A699ZFI6_HAELA|nr:hypothetical protein HaLaN_10363 [Haematococcus lacustris]
MQGGGSGMAPSTLPLPPLVQSKLCKEVQGLQIVQGECIEGVLTTCKLRAWAWAWQAATGTVLVSIVTATSWDYVCVVTDAVCQVLEWACPLLIDPADPAATVGAGTCHGAPVPTHPLDPSRHHRGPVAAPGRHTGGGAMPAGTTAAGVPNLVFRAAGETKEAVLALLAANPNLLGLQQ